MSHVARPGGTSALLGGATVSASGCRSPSDHDESPTPRSRQIRKLVLQHSETIGVKSASSRCPIA